MLNNQQIQNISNIDVYVGEDGKLHFKDGGGADTALNFSGSIFANQEDSRNLFPIVKSWVRADYSGTYYGGACDVSNIQILLTTKGTTGTGNSTISIIFPYLLDFSKINSFTYYGQDLADSSCYSYLLDKSFDLSKLSTRYNNIYPTYTVENIYKDAYGDGYVVPNSVKNAKVGYPAKEVTIDYSEFNGIYYFGITYWTYGQAGTFWFNKFSFNS